MFLVYCPACDQYSRLATVGQRVQFEGRIDVDTGRLRPLDRQHLLDEVHSDPERLWCAVCDSSEATIAELATCPCEGTTPTTEGQYWWEVRHQQARCTLCGKSIQGSIRIEWGAG